MTKQEEFEKAIKLNDAEKVAELLKDKNVDPSAKSDYAFFAAACSGYFETTELLMSKCPEIDPSQFDNYAIYHAYNAKYQNIVSLLWNDKRVKDSLKYDNIEIFNTLMKGTVNNKLKRF